MRVLLLMALTLAALLVACSDDDSGGGGGGGGDSDLGKQLADVCTEGEEADTENIVVNSPDEGDEVSSPLTVSGEIVAFEQQFWVSAVKADGEHLIDYPGRSRDLVENELSPFEVSVPFTVFEETPACIWVYRRNVEEPEDAIRVPVVLQPADPEGAAQ